MRWTRGLVSLFLEVVNDEFSLWGDGDFTDLTPDFDGQPTRIWGGLPEG